MTELTLADIVREVLAPAERRPRNWDGVDVDVLSPPCSRLLDTLLAVAASSPEAVVPAAVAVPVGSRLARRLSEAFPGRESFCARLAASLEIAFRMWQAEGQQDSGSQTGLRSPHALILGQSGVGKTFLLSEVLPRVVPDCLTRLFEITHTRPEILYVDSRHVVETAHRMNLSGPGGVVRALYLAADQDVRASAGTVAAIGLDHVEAFWSPSSEPRMPGSLSPETLCAALAAVLRGVRCRVEADSGGVTVLDTQRMTFVVVAHVARLRQVLEENPGSSSSRTVTAQILVGAGVPNSLAFSFPSLLILPPVLPSEYFRWLEGQAANPNHAGFATLALVARSLGCEELTFSSEATRWLFQATYAGKPDFTRLEQILVGLSSDLLERSEALGKAIQIRPDHLELAMLRSIAALFEL